MKANEVELKAYPFINSSKDEIKKIGMDILKRYSKQFLNDSHNTIILVK